MSVKIIFDHLSPSLCLASKKSTTTSHMDVDKELFLWSIVTGKQAFALLFWARGKNKICE